MAERFARVKQYAREYGRDPESISMTLRADGIGPRDPERSIEKLRAYAEIGVSMAMLTLIGPNAAAIDEKMAAFMRHVAPKV